MSLSGILATAASGLANVNQQLAIVSQNVANASTPGYAEESAANTDLTAGGQGFGVVTGPATAAVDNALQSALNTENATVAGAQVRAAALAAVDAAQGTTSAGNDLASTLGALQNSFTALSADPSNQTAQAAVVSAAQIVASGIQTQAAAYTAARQTAQNSAVSDVATLNATIGTIGTLSSQIVALQARGVSTADLQAQRTAQETTASQLAGVQFLPVSDGDVTALLGGLVVNTRASSGPFSIASTTLGNGSPTPPLDLSGVAVTSQVTAGSIGANLTLRDQDLPQAQAGLDEFAETLATRLNNQGLALFTDPAGSVPAAGGTPVQSGYVGFSNDVTVNPAVVAKASLVRDGTQAVAAGAGGASAFATNPAGGPASFSTLIDRVLQYGLGSQSQSGTAQVAPNSTGLGATGTLSLSYAAGTTLQSFAANLVSAQAQKAGAAQDALTTGQSVQATLQSKLSSETGVSVDTELSNMVVLQNAYGANAKILTAAQSMWSALLAAVNA